MSRRFVVKIGQPFNRWTLVREVARHPISGNRMFLCRCLCGNTVIVRLADVVNGRSQSCGCLVTERITTHGCSKNPLYVIWKGMRHRCYDQMNDSYPRYGGRGIGIAKEWDDVREFIKWAEVDYSPGLTLHRKDNNGDYCPENCTWATIKEQQNHRSTNRVIEHEGKILTLAQWGDLLKINRRTLLNRLRIGWTTTKTLTTPVKIHRKKGVACGVQIAL